MKKTKQWLHESAFSFSGNVIILYVISFASLQAGLIFGFRHWIHPLHDTTSLEDSIAPVFLSLFILFLLLYRKRVLYKKKQKQLIAVSAFSTIH
ncbi:hypothetical protein [Bacillus sp. LK2]|uniref:hypothetical protein n=1 Tax=Bacillus sp. LK2 TaxID=1628206 RepID=UPI0006534190|nr:hypothetical protein [Bacillus sp. LK2]KMN42721.1 hypothetical protein VK90_22320 [Bacillus sp. LK2]